MKILLSIAVITCMSISCLLFYASTRPHNISLERSTAINAPASMVFALINDFRLWTWSPWDGIDPSMTRSYTGAAAGLGSIYEWEGNRKVGSGRMEMLQSQAPSNILIQLDFFKPFAANNRTEFNLTESAGVTTVIWRMHGPQPFVAKLMGAVSSIEKMVGPDFEKGLAALKALAEHA